MMENVQKKKIGTWAFPGDRLGINGNPPGLRTRLGDFDQTPNKFPRPPVDRVGQFGALSSLWDAGMTVSKVIPFKAG